MSKQSACALLMKKAYTDVWMRGREYAQKGCVDIVVMDDRHIEAFVKGTKLYNVNLSFVGSGISKKCTCPYASGSQARHAACKHMAAVAIVWDERRGIPSPDIRKIEAYTVPPLSISRAQINKMFTKPLQADLQVLRTLAEERGSWSRPHSKLPDRPSFSDDANKPLDREELEAAFKEITKWTRRSRYDPYFCAGEMVVAYCEVMRSVKKRLGVSDLLTAAAILLDAQKFHYKLVMELIDDSDGLHVFTEAHLEDIFKALKDITIASQPQPEMARILNEYEAHKNHY